MSVFTCWKCKTKIGLPPELAEAATKSQRVTFYCPYGHPCTVPDKKETETTGAITGAVHQGEMPNQVFESGNVVQFKPKK